MEKVQRKPTYNWAWKPASGTRYTLLYALVDGKGATIQQSDPHATKVDAYATAHELQQASNSRWAILKDNETGTEILVFDKPDVWRP